MTTNTEQSAEQIAAPRAVDRTQPPASPAPAAPPLPRPDASEPAELVPVAVRGYN